MTAYERRTGLVHEATNYNSGNELQEYEPPAPKVDPQVKQALINDMRDAIASGPFTSPEVQ